LESIAVMRRVCRINVVFAGVKYEAWYFEWSKNYMFTPRSFGWIDML
jgi:hypothetical protein